ncbi:MAG: DUF3566 domain-containing protein [Acidimicrobiia bacterium]|nr:DUF3566 domain-containing protein [Acidimicrobiia bacterium]
MAVRRVRRIVRKIDPWTVLKVSLVLWTVVMLAVLLGLVIMWSLLRNAGTPDTILDFINGFGLFEPITLEGQNLFRAVLFMCITSAILLSGVSTLMAVFYNLISDIVGGIEVVVLEEVLPQPAAPRPSAPVRSPADYTTAERQEHATQPTEETVLG